MNSWPLGVNVILNFSITVAEKVSDVSLISVSGKKLLIRLQLRIYSAVGSIM